MKILIIEDDVALAQGIAMVLKEEGYQICLASSLKEGKTCLAKDNIGLLILDINLPDGNGLEFLRVHRKELSMPVLMLTAKDTEEDEIGGFEAGADEYITKPFRIGILRARVQSLIRRTKNPKVFEFGSFYLDFEKRIYKHEGKEISLSKVEQELLYLFLLHPGQTLTRNQIISKIWDSSDSVDENTLTVTVGRLRNKLEGNYIRTVYGLGYRWQESTEEQKENQKKNLKESQEELQKENQKKNSKECKEDAQKKNSKKCKEDAQKETQENTKENREGHP